MCPVCGYPAMEEPPDDFAICPCCGVEFGYDDAEMSHAELRQHWLDSGAHWFSGFTQPPANWNPYAQLIKAGLVHVLATDAPVERLDILLEHLVSVSGEASPAEAGLSEISLGLAA